MENFCFSYAITRLKQAPDDDLVLYLLQLVQALKYENFDDIEVSIGFGSYEKPQKCLRLVFFI